MQLHLQIDPTLRIDIIRGDVHLDGVSFGRDDPASAQVVRELSRSRHRQHPHPRRRRARRAAGGRRVSLADQGRADDEPVEAQLAAAQHHGTSASAGWCRSTPGGARSNGPTRRPGRSIPAYAESLVLAQQTFDNTAAGKRLDPGDRARPRAAADPQGRAQQRRAGPDSGGQAVREPDLLPFGERRDAEPAARQADRARRTGHGGAGRSGAAARHRQDADSARDREEAGRARQARAEDDRGAHDVRRRDPGADRRAAAADADRGARAPPRRRRHAATRISATPCRTS